VTSLLSARAVEVRYEGSVRAAVLDAGLELEAGAALGIVGESGSGKTTLARTLVGALEPTAGEVTISGRSWASVRRDDPLRRAVQMVFQDPYASLNPILSAQETVAEVFRVWEGLSRRESRERAEALLAEVGLVGDSIKRKPASLSGGQRQRVGIARALACDPDVLVADEPTSSLDVSVQAQILNLLADLRERRHLALIIVSHDLSVVRHMTDRAIVMYGGRIVERATTVQIFEAPRHPYTRILIDSVPERVGEARMVVNESVPADGEGCVFARRCAFVQSDCLKQHPPLLGDARHEVSCYHPLVTVQPTLDVANERRR
jgi:oligopeptide/dipeptide ABC transporter ATP-binding protein